MNQDDWIIKLSENSYKEGFNDAINCISMGIKGLDIVKKDLLSIEDLLELLQKIKKV